MKMKNLAKLKNVLYALLIITMLAGLVFIGGYLKTSPWSPENPVTWREFILFNIVSLVIIFLAFILIKWYKELGHRNYFTK